MKFHFQPQLQENTLKSCNEVSTLHLYKMIPFATIAVLLLLHFGLALLAHMLILLMLAWQTPYAFHVMRCWKNAAESGEYYNQVISGCWYLPLTIICIVVLALLFHISVYHVLLAILAYAVMSDYLPLIALQVFRYVVARNIEEAQIIIDAVEAFHTETGHYPKELTDLIPDYLQSVPQGFFPAFGIKKSLSNMNIIRIEHFISGRAILKLPFFSSHDRIPHYDFIQHEWISNCWKINKRTGECKKNNTEISNFYIIRTLMRKLFRAIYES